MDPRIVRKPELLAMIGLSDASIWRRERNNEFPRRIKLGGNSVGWLESEVLEWLSSKATDRQPARGPDRHSVIEGGADR